MPPEASEISKWIPVIGTLLGAIIAFLGFFSIAVYNQHKAEKIAKENRRRERLEVLFKSLIIVDSQYRGFAISLSSGLFPEFEKKEIPPLLEIEMMINLYFNELKDAFDEFDVERRTFGKLFSKITSQEFQTFSAQEKKQICDEVIPCHKIFINKLKLFQDGICKHINP